MLKHEFAFKEPLPPSLPHSGYWALGVERALKDVINVTPIYKEFISRCSGLMSKVQPVSWLLHTTAGLSHPCSACIAC